MLFETDKIDTIPIGQLTIDRRVQRSYLNKRHAKRIAEGFDPSAFRVITVSVRDNGEKIVLDGQHRVDALRILGFDEDTEVPCDIRYGLSLNQEAALFRLLNNMKNPQYTDRFLVRVVEGEIVATDITQIVRGFGWEIHPSKGDGMIAAVDALERVYTGEGYRRMPKGNDPVALARTLMTITSAWGYNSAGVVSSMLTGIGAIYRAYGDQVEQDALIRKLQNFQGGPGGLVGQARTHSVSGNKANYSSVAYVLVSLYNKGKRSNALPGWQI